MTRQGIVIPADVSFAALGNNLYRHGMTYHGQMGVASAVLSYTYLWNVIRVQNGAYGAGMSVGDLGEVRLSTYRDPHPAASLEAFLGAGAHLAANIPDSRALERLIRRLDLRNTYYFGSHPSNLVPMQGRLPEQKQDMIDVIRETREALRTQLDMFPLRGGEGAVLN